MSSSQLDLARAVQIALIGEVPPTLRFVAAHLDGETLVFRAVFDPSASEDHLECARVVCTEVLASCRANVKLLERIEVDAVAPWQDEREHLLYLRYGELSG